jgi:hypothetical protein
MIATRFRSVYWVGGVAVAALSCYLVSQRVAAERANLAKVETAILIGERQIRALETEIGTRAGMKQIERWNVEVLSLSAPKAGQFVADEAQLASLMQPVQPAMEAPAAVQVAAIEEAPEALPHITRASYEAPPTITRIAETKARPAHKPEKLANADPVLKAEKPVRGASKPEKLARAKPEADRAARTKPQVEKLASKKAEAKPERTRLASAKDAKPRAERERVAERKRDRAPERQADNTPRLRSAVFVKPTTQKAPAAQRVALLDSKLLGDLGKLARNERTGGKRDR